MKKVNLVIKMSILFIAILVTSCNLVRRRDIPKTNSATTITTVKNTDSETFPSTLPQVSLIKTITDNDLKKNYEDKELKKRVVVLPFIDKQARRNLTVLKKANDAFMDSLNLSAELIAIDSSVLKLDLSKYIKDNRYDLLAIAKASQTAGISSILEGRIIDMRFKDENQVLANNSSSLKSRAVVFEIVVQARMLNIRSEQELFNTVKTISISEENSKIPENISSENFFNRNPELTELLIKDAFLDFNTKLIDSLKFIIWEGRIAALQGERIYLNVGQISGVQIGDILKVVDDANEIYDTELGYHVGQVRGRVKGTLEVVSFFGQDGAVSVVHSGAGFKENDRVELYQ